MSTVSHDKARKEVSRVLSNLLNVRAAADWRAESSFTALDAALPGRVRTTVLRGADVCGRDALGVARPRAAKGAPMPGLIPTYAQTSVFEQQDAHKKYQHTTRAAGLAGSATGSHPASWDPV